MIADRLESRSIRIPESGCRLWLGGLSGTGYGHFEVRGKTILAHRAAWAVAYGFVPVGLCVLHHCDVRCCIEPTHLFLGTRADNNADRDRKGRNGDVRGERNSQVRYSDAQVAAMRADKRTAREIAADYGTTGGYVRQLRSYKRKG